MSDEMHNRRSYDGKIGLALSITALVSALWGGVTWLNGYIVTNEELAKQQYYTDYHVARLRLDFTNTQLAALEAKLDGEGLTPSERRRYDSLVKMRERLKIEVEELAETF